MVYACGVDSTADSDWQDKFGRVPNTLDVANINRDIGTEFQIWR